MDNCIGNRPLFRSFSMNERHTSKMDKLNGELIEKRQNSHSLDFTEYVYHDNGFRRFKGVSSLLVQNLGKEMKTIGDLGSTDEQGVKCDSIETIIRNGGIGDELARGICASTFKDFQQLEYMNGNPLQLNVEHQELNGGSDEANVTDNGKRNRPKTIVRRWTLYDRERKPHYCSNHVPPEPLARPSAWSYGGKKSNETPTTTTPRKHVQSWRSGSSDGGSNSSSVDLLNLPSRKISQTRSVSSASSEFDFDAVINGPDSNEVINIELHKGNGMEATALTERGPCTQHRNGAVTPCSSSKPSQIPRPVCRYSFSSTNWSLDTVCYRSDDSQRRNDLRRTTSLVERRPHRDRQLPRLPRSPSISPRSPPTTPIRCYQGDASFVVNRHGSVYPHHEGDISLGNRSHSIAVSEDEDGYPEATPSSRAKSDIFHPRDFIQIDQHSQQAPNSLLGNFDELVDFLTGGLTNDMCKLRAIYRWLVSQPLPLNVKPGEISKDSPIWFLYTIREKRAAFSELFAVLCRRAHLPCVIIYGVAKSVAYDVGDKVTHKRLKNSWNAVFVEGEWRLVHPYWSRQSVRGYDSGRWAVVECDEFHADDLGSNSKQTVTPTQSDFFFLTDPERFITKCFPEDPSWQLLPKPLTKAEFEDLPFLQPAFYELNLQVKSHTSCVIHTSTGRVELTLGLPVKMAKRYHFLYKLFIHRDWEAEGEYDQILLDKYLLHYVYDDIAMFEIRFPVNGVYKLELHCRDRLKPLPSDWVCDYRIVCYDAMPDCKPLPVVPSIGWGIGTELEESGLDCLTHQNALVNLDKEIVNVIRFATPKDKPVSVEAELLNVDMTRDELLNHVTVEQDDDLALVKISPPTEGEYALQIFVKEDGEEKRKNVCNFLMHRTQIVEDPELADIRNELIKATESGDADSLSLWVERFMENGMEDRGDLTRARLRLQLSRINRDLKEAILRKDLDYLERALNSASDTSLKRHLGHLAEEAEAMRSRLRRLKRLQHAILDLDAKTISEMRSYPKPPAAVHGVMAATFMLLGNREVELKKWSKIQSLISKHGKDSLKRRVAQFNISNVPPNVLTRVRAILSKYDLETVQIASIGAATFYQWAFTMAREAVE